MDISMLISCSTYITCVCQVPKKVRRGCQIPEELELRMACVTLWVLGIKPDPLQKQRLLSQISSHPHPTILNNGYISGFPQPLPQVAYRTE